jgi:hypothetical protein
VGDKRAAGYDLLPMNVAEFTRFHRAEVAR